LAASSIPAPTTVVRVLRASGTTAIRPRKNGRAISSLWMERALD